VARLFHLWLALVHFRNVALAILLLGDVMNPSSRATSAVLLRRYCVGITGEAIGYIESFVEPGRYLVQRLDWRGQPLDSEIQTVREIQGMKLFTNLREARAYAGKQVRQAAFIAAGKDANGR
jgi:hypothetical protein